VYDGDTTSRGLGVDFFAATEAQKQLMVSDPTNNLFLLDDGRLVQWRMRQRTIAGAGNGDWLAINTTKTTGSLRFDAQSPIMSQGVLDSAPAYSDASNDNTFRSFLASANDNPELGVFTVIDTASPDRAINGECYFHVWGTAERLNQGAYHPSFNPMGTATWRQNGVGYAHWYDRITGFDGYQSTSECFYFQDASGNGVYGGQIGSSSNGIGRDDGRFYDAIYTGGQGGVTDLRLSAWDMSSKEEASKVFQKVVNGSYRGEELLTKTKVFGSPQGATYQGVVSGMYKWYASAADFVISDGALGASGTSAPIIGWLVQDSKVFPVTYLFQASGSSTTQIYCGQSTWENTKPNGVASDIVSNEPMYFVHHITTNIPVSGEFTMQDVIGDPANILAIPDLANGWLGGWIPEIPVAIGQNYPLNKKYLGYPDGSSSTVIHVTQTTNAGASWGVITPALDVTRNHWFATLGYTYVGIIQYTAFAKQTVESVNKAVLNGSEGLGDVYTSCYNTTDTGNLLCESLISKVMTNDTSFSPRIAEMSLLNKALRPEGNLNDVSTSWADYNHESIPLAQPANNSPAVKTLWYQTSDNGQVGLNFAYNELVYSVLPHHVVNESSLGIIQGHMYVAQGKTGGTSQYNLAGHIFKANGTNSGFAFRDMYMAQDGVVMYMPSSGSSAPSLDSNLTEYRIGDEWGDDSTIRITGGQSTYTNLNGDTCLFGSNELALPYGYIRNQARAGSQVKGVDVRALPRIVPSHYAAVMPYKGEEDVRTNTGTVSHW
jgi:hypothetical protein